MQGVGMPDNELEEARRDYVAAMHDARMLAKGVGFSIWHDFLMDMGAAYEMETHGGLARDGLKSAPPEVAEVYGRYRNARMRLRKHSPRRWGRS